MGKSPMASVRYMKPPHSAIQGSPPARAVRMDVRMAAFSLSCRA